MLHEVLFVIRIIKDIDFHLVTYNKPKCFINLNNLCFAYRLNGKRQVFVHVDSEV